MIIKTLTLKNFRKFKYSVIEFSDGITGITGLNGVGKSTIFEALAWTLYGPVAARTSADQIKRENAEHSDPCRIELEFIFEDDSYRIVREMTGKNLTASASATVNGKLAANGAEVVSKYVQKKLGMDFKSFFTSIFAKQKELNTLSSMNASERRPLILRMLGIDELDEVIREIRSDKKNKEGLIEKLSLDLVDEQGKSKIDNYRDEINILEKSRKETDLEIQQVKKQIQVFKKELESLEKNYVSQKKQYEKMNLRKEKLTERKTFFENKRRLQDEIRNLHAKVKDRKKTIETQRKNLKAFGEPEKDIKQDETRLNEVAAQKEKTVKEIEQKKTLVEGLRRDIQDIDSKRKKITSIGPDAKCPTCDRALADQYDTLLKRFDKEKQEKNKEIKDFLEAVKTMQQSYERISRQEQALQKKRNYLQGQLREKEKIDTTICNVQAELKRETTEIEQKEKQLREIGRVDFDPREFETVRKQVDELYKKYQSSLELLNEKKDQLGDANVNLEKKEGDKKVVAQEIKNLQGKILELEEFKKRLTDEKKTVQNLNMLSEVMSSFRTHLISRIRPALSSYASDFFERLTDGKYREIELDDDYNLRVYDDGKAYDIERFSGGEEDLANLCLRLAISEVITERAGGIFNLIILDEIFGSQDNIRRQNIMKALNSLSSKFRQIFLITHVDDVKNYMENIIYVSENEQGISNVKIE